MQANPTYATKDRKFWAQVKLISQLVGYTDRRTKTIKRFTLLEVRQALLADGLSVDWMGTLANPSQEAIDLIKYSEYRSDVLTNEVRQNLMNLEQAKALFYDLKGKYNPTCPIPLNKQSGVMKDYNFFTGIVNILIDESTGRSGCDFDPRALTVITRDSEPLRTLSRRVDGAYPSTVNPKAIWEIKEYYYTTTFGSRVADGVYETLLDGTELQELYDNEGVDVKHYLFVDAYKTWWEDGRSYLCRMIDMINMGLVDEVIFGREAVTRIPHIVKNWG
ncbi:DUF7687 domain-containing protein [Burkholderia ubonensis]|uniref:DUF7687 domain-containing protein n=1 Tax=Burkholderia ubonensis TaxID=101571 RepID=UPI001582E836|nr:hypothetical protein [Burkholderia ubonensis]